MEIEPFEYVCIPRGGRGHGLRRDDIRDSQDDNHERNVEQGSEELLRTSGSYARDDIVPGESPLVTIVNGDANAEEIASAIKQVSLSASKI